VLIDECTVMLRLVDRMLKTGARRLAYVHVQWPDKENQGPHASESQRRDAYAWSVVCETWPWELAEQLPAADAYCCYSEGDAAMVHGILSQRGSQAPIGCLSGSGLPSLLHPQPLTVNLPVAAMAKRTVDLLLQRIAGEASPPRCERLA
jgi:hypothetical protein